MPSLNLLPEERKQNLLFRFRLNQWRSAILLAVIGGLLASAATMAMDIALARSMASSNTTLQNWQELSAKRKSGRVTLLTREVNQTTAGLEALFTPLSLNQPAMSQLLSVLPEGISISSATFLRDGQFTINGIAASRSSFLALRTALETSPAVATVTTTSTASQRENLPFEYSGQLVIQP